MDESGFREGVTIIGLGLLGTSLALALKARGVRVGAWTRRAEVLKWALEEGAVDEVFASSGEAVSKAALTVLCLPVPGIIEFIREHAGDWRRGAVVSDVGSVKGIVVREAAAILSGTGVEFVGAHPMAGTEKSGPEHGFKELYEGAEIFVTPSRGVSEAALARVRGLWEGVGGNVRELSAGEHDALVARTSHLPHVLSLSLTRAVLDCNEEERRRRYLGCAGAFRDCTRISSSSPSMWREIIEANRDEVLSALAEARAELERIDSWIKEGEFDLLEEGFERGRHLREEWMAYRDGKGAR